MSSPKRHPVAKTYPRPRAGHPARIELNVLKLDADGNSIYDGEFDENVCDCFPSTSSKHIPSMLYDHINCPHHSTKHIQPAQDQVFAYPWTANSEMGRKKRGKFRDVDEDSLASGKLSVIAEESFTPMPNITRTAPPFARERKTEHRRAPYTAPADDRVEHYDTQYRRSESVPSLTAYQPSHPIRVDPEISTPYVQRVPGSQRQRPITVEDRRFDGHYIDPKDGQVYKFKVKYGKRQITANRYPENTILE